MTAPRRIRRLELRAPPGVGLAGPEALVTDALRTASVPGLPPGAVLVIRRLDLGRLSRHLPPATLALRIEAHLRRLSTRAVRFAPERVADAPAVWFADPSEPPVAYMRARVTSAAAGEWVWSKIIPGASDARDPVAATRAAIRAAMETDSPALTIARVLDVLAVGHRLDWFVTAFDQADAAALWRACGWSAPGAPVARPSPPPFEPSAAWRSAVTALMRTPPAGIRVRWLATMALVARRPALLGLSEPWRLGDALCAALLPAGRAPSHRARREAEGAVPPLFATEASQPAASVVPHPHVGADGPPETAEALSAFDPPRAARSRPREPSTRAADDVASASCPGPREAPPEPQRFDQPVATAFGGLLFLVPVLRRLGIEAVLERDPRRPDLAGHVLQAALVAAGATPDDPLYDALDRSPDLGAPLPFSAPAIWWKPAPHGLRDIASPLTVARRRGDPNARVLCVDAEWPIALWRGERPADVPPGEGPGPMLSAETDLAAWVAAWLGAADRWLERHADLDLESCIRRPGAVTLSPTHVTAIFDLADADIRVRRAALDIDPGFVPWLGRVIHYHYLHGGRY